MQERKKLKKGSKEKTGHELAQFKLEAERKRAKRERDREQELLSHYDNTHDSNL